MSSSEEDLFEIRSCRFGKGLFALRKIPANTVVCKITGQEFFFFDTLKLGERESHAMQIDVDKYILCDSPFLYSNHSCEPNCAVNENVEFYTLTEVEKDQELLWDYSTSMLERHWTMRCACDAKNCRKLITDFDLLPPSIQQNYIRKKLVLPFILHQLNRRIDSTSGNNVIRKSA